MSLTNSLKFMLDLAVLWVIVFPITTFLHECGHALAALVSKDHAVTIKDGRWTRPVDMAKRQAAPGDKYFAGLRWLHLV